MKAIEELQKKYTAEDGKLKLSKKRRKKSLQDLSDKRINR